MKLKHALSPSGKEGQIECKDPTLAQQSMAHDTNINIIVAKFVKTGQMPYASLRVPTYGDFNQISDFRTAYELVQDAERAFMRLPAGLRAELNNDPAMFIAFASDPRNLDEMRRWGLAPPKEPAPAPAAPAPAAPAPAAPAPATP